MTNLSKVLCINSDDEIKPRFDVKEAITEAFTGKVPTVTLIDFSRLSEKLGRPATKDEWLRFNEIMQNDEVVK